MRAATGTGLLLDRLRVFDDEGRLARMRLGVDRDDDKAASERANGRSQAEEVVLHEDGHAIAATPQLLTTAIAEHPDALDLKLDHVTRLD